MALNLLVQTAMLVCAVLGIYVVALSRFPAQATTMAFLALGLAELPLAYTSRSERFSVLQIGLFSNRKMQWAALLSLVGMLAVVYVPFLNSIFGTLPLGWVHWAWVLPVAFVPAVVAEIVKWALRHRSA